MEQRLIDANNLGVGKANPGIFVCKEYAHGWNNALQAVVEAAPTIDHENLPIVRQLRAELARVTAERDAAVDDLAFAVNKYRLFTTDINLCCLCKFDFPPAGKNEQTYECPGCYGDDCFEWRGPRKEE